MLCDENRFDFRPFKRIVHPKNEKSPKIDSIQDVDDFVSSSEQIWGN